MNSLGVTADMTIKTNGNSLCVIITDVCRLLNLNANEKVRVTIEPLEE